MNKNAFVLFDLDNTILDFGKAETIALTAALTELSVDVSEEMIVMYKSFNAFCWEALERGEMARSEVLVTRFKMLFEKYGLTVDAAEAQSKYENLLKIGHYFMPGAEKLLDDLCGKYRMFIVSNGNIATQEARLKSSGISRYFEKIFVSEVIGADKPSRLFFDRCFSQIKDFDKARSIIIGDSLTSDIQGGINAGIRTCLYDVNNKYGSSTLPDYHISSLNDVPKLLSEIF